MTILIVRVRVKIPDNTSDKELNEILKRYIDVMPAKAISARKISDTLEWLV